MSIEIQDLTLSEAYEIVITKASRRRRIVNRYARLHSKAQRKMMPVVNEWMDWANKKIRSGLGGMSGRTAAAKVNSIADWDAIHKRGEKLLTPMELAVLEDGGNSVMGQRIIKQDRFDPIGAEAIKWSTEHTAALVVEITDKTMQAIQEYITLGIKEGKSLQKIAMELRPLVGLTERNLMAVANFHEMLILERPDWTVAQQRQSANVYARRLHRLRAMTITRTETAYALTEGQRQGYGQMGVKKLERVEDFDSPDDDCQMNNGRVYSLAAASGVLPAHPNCEGSWVAAT